MFLVETYLRQSPIEGIGVFAMDFIPNGTKIAKWLPGFDCKLTKQAVDDLPEQAKSYMRHHAYLDGDFYYLNGDNMRFLNYAPDPNTKQVEDEDFAARDIQPGEEITCDYFSFDADATRKLWDLVMDKKI